MIKRRLYRALRSNQTSNWVPILEKTVRNINNTPKPSLGNLIPSQVQNSDSDIIIIDRLKKLGKWTEPLPVKKQSQLMEDFLKKNKDFSIGSYVLKEMSKRIELEKGTSIKVSSSLFCLLLAVSNVLWYKFAHYFFTWLA